MPKKAFIGIDTSNYTTSFAICDINGVILKNYKILLPVKEGERGLRQSDAVFAHIKNLPLIAQRIKEDCEDYEILAIGHSAYPRDVESSYMPCFLVGKALSEILASLYKVENFKFSHQAGHIRAAVYSSNAKTDKNFIAFHVSGGTTEILHVSKENSRYIIEILGGSNDLHAGQAIDRIGVKMGLKFPCGPKIEQLALKNTEKIPNYRISVNNFSCNLSGLENIASNLLDKTGDLNLVSDFVLDFISNTIIRLTQNLRNTYPNEQIIYAGGVMSNSIIKNKIKKKFDNVYFALPEFSSDNAAGTALLTYMKYFNKED